SNKTPILQLQREGEITMGTESSLSSVGDTSEKDPAPALNEEQSRKRVFGSDLMVREGGFVGLVGNNVGVSGLNQIHELASSVLEFSRKWEEIDERYTYMDDLIKERAMEAELREKSVMERGLELEKKAERLKEVEERERKIGLLEKSMTFRLEEKEIVNDVKQYLVSSVISLVLEKANEEAMGELEERGKEVERSSKSNDEKSCELEKTVKEFNLKQKESIEERSKEAELVKESLKQLEAREKELSLLDETVKEKATELEKKEEIFEAEQKAKSEEMELKSKFLEVKEKKLEEREKEVILKKRELEEGFDGLKEKGKETERLSKLNDEKSCELERKMKEFDLKQKVLIERRNKDAELLKESLKQLEEGEKELSLLDEAIEELIELEKKEELFEAEQKVKSEEIELKSKFLEVKEKKLEEREKEIELKKSELEEKVKSEEKEKKPEERNLQEGSIQAETCKRSRVQLLAEKGSEASSSTHPAKKRRSHNHDDADKEKDLACADSASTSSFEQTNKAHEEETDKNPEQRNIVDSEFHDFKKTMSSFVVDTIWAVNDPKDGMPRFYAKINRICKSGFSLDVTWFESIDEESVHVACGRFTYGSTESISHLTFSHELQHTIHGGDLVTVNPKKGETWALYTDWSKSWDSNPEQHKPPYRYDLVEIVNSFDDDLGVGVSYLGKVRGFVSVFESVEKDGVFQFLIAPGEMHRFSHRVPSVRLSGEEKEGVPADSFELDPAAVPSYILLEDSC
ncbi:unnamed protein product, partial [Thlaspi arvense]